MDNQIDRAMRVGRGYWFVDGFTEILAGGLFVLLGSVLLLRSMVSQGSLLDQVAATASDIGFIKAFGFLAAGLILWGLKDRFTYPRTGFVRGKRVTLVQMLPILRNALLCLLLPLLALLAAFFFLPSIRAIFFSMPAWSPVVISAIWAALCFLLGRWLGVRRFTRLGVGVLLIGIGICIWQLAAGLPHVPPDALQSGTLTSLPDSLRILLAETLNRAFVSLGLLSLGSGAIFAVSGGITFLRYQKENPLPYQEEA